MSGCGGSDGKNSGGTGWVEIDDQKVKKESVCSEVSAPAGEVGCVASCRRRVMNYLEVRKMRGQV